MDPIAAFLADKGRDLPPIVGPAQCHDCHIGGMVWFGPPVGWQQRIFLEETLGVKVYAYVTHRCTARAPLRIENPGRFIGR